VKGDRGFTLIELTIVVLLLGVLGLITTSVVINAFHRQAEADGRAVAISTVRTGLQRVVRDLRQADFPLLELSNTNLVMDVTNGATTTTICYAAIGTSLTRSVSPPRTAGTPSSGCPAGSQTNTEATDLANTNVFSVPYAATDYTLNSTLETSDPPCALKLDPGLYDVRCPGAVMVELTVIPKNASTGATLCPTGTIPSQCDIDVSDTAELRNTP